MRDQTTVKRPREFLLALGLALLVAVGGSNAQSVGSGASPGRAAYRPQGDWNDGPYYTVNHVNPYTPKSAVANDLFESQPTQPPYSNGPRGIYGEFTPDRGSLKPYSEGFSPYSGYSRWYQKTYGVNPTREDVERARAAFFRSAPRPPAGVLPALPPSGLVQPLTVQKPATRTKIVERSNQPVKPTAGTRARRIPIYRSQVTGS